MSETPQHETAQPTSAPTPATPRGRRRGLLIVLAILAVGGSAYGVHLYVWNQTHERTDDAQVEGHVHLIASQVAGCVAEVCIHENESVRAGDVLVRIRPEDFDARAAQATAQLAQAQADQEVAMRLVTVLRGTTESSTRQARAAVAQDEAGLVAALREVDATKARLAAEVAGRDQAEAQKRAAQANYEYAAWDRERVVALYEKNQAAEDELRRAETACDAAEANLAAARELVNQSGARVRAAETAIAAAEAQVTVSRASLDEKKAKLDSALTGPDQVRIAEARIELMRAGVQAAQAQLDAARLQRGYCEIAAPVSGIVTKRSVEVGQFLQPGQPFLAIVPLDDTWVVANFKETEVHHMRPGQRVVLKVDAYPGHPFEAVVDSIAAGTGARFSLLPPENATGNYVKVVQRIPVKVVPAPGQRDPSRPLRPGMNVIVTVDTGAAPTSPGSAESRPTSHQP